MIKELLSASVDSMENTTARGETALHLAVNNHQFQAFKALVEYLKEFKKEDLLNGKDGQGNTILHLAASRKQYEVRITPFSCLLSLSIYRSLLLPEQKLLLPEQ